MQSTILLDNLGKPLGSGDSFQYYCSISALTLALSNPLKSFEVEMRIGQTFNERQDNCISFLSDVPPKSALHPIVYYHLAVNNLPVFNHNDDISG